LRILLSPAGILLLLIFIMSFGMTNFQGMIGLYVVDKFAFNTKQVGAIWMVMGGVLILGQGILVGPLSKKYGDLPLIKTGLLGGAFGFVLVAFSVDYTTTLLALALFVFALALTVMGLNSAFTSLGRVVGPLWGGYIYDININYPFFSGAVTLLLGLFVGIIGLRKQAVDNPIPA
jgi:DHA1 family multidrug resistance protein-like MFS transporter